MEADPAISSKVEDASTLWTSKSILHTLKKLMHVYKNIHTVMLISAPTGKEIKYGEIVCSHEKNE